MKALIGWATIRVRSHKISTVIRVSNSEFPIRAHALKIASCLSLLFATWNPIAFPWHAWKLAVQLRAWSMINTVFYTFRLRSPSVRLYHVGRVNCLLLVLLACFWRSCFSATLTGSFWLRSVGRCAWTWPMNSTQSVNLWLEAAFRNFLCDSGKSVGWWIVASMNRYCIPCNVCAIENRTDTGIVIFIL